MKIILIAACLCTLLTTTSAQVKPTIDCGTRSPRYPLFIDSVALANRPNVFTVPYIMKVFVFILADDNGMNVAVQDTSVLRQLFNARDFYAPHDICFILAGMERLNNTDLNDHDVETEETELNPYLLPNIINVFVHSNLRAGTLGLNGNAYGIPSNYISMSAGAIASISNRSTLAHELGHGFGLYHTFETYKDNDGNETRPENVPRSGPCTNCSINGDLLCDTEADRDEGVDSNCVYTGTRRDACNFLFTPNTRNIMTYGNRDCRNFFTFGQGQRALNMIAITPSLNSTIAPDEATALFNVTYTAGRVFMIARNSISISAGSYVVSNTAKMNMNSKSTVIGPGTRFSPTNDGYTIIRTNTLCQ